MFTFVKIYVIIEKTLYKVVYLYEMSCMRFYGQ